MRARTLLVCLFVVALVAPTGVVAITGEPSLSATMPENRVSPGDEAELTVQITNVGSLEESASPQVESRLTTARGVQMTLEAGNAPVTVESAPASLGSIADGQTVQSGVRIEVAEDAEPGTYRLRVRLRYHYTEEIDDFDGEHEEVRKTRYATVRLVVEPEARFRLVDATTDASVGDAGNVTLGVRNVGSATARDARVNVRSASAEFRVGANGTASRFVGAWDPGETATVTVPATVLPDAARRNYTLTSVVAYADDANRPRQSATLVAGVVPGREQRFSLAESAATLTVGERGTVNATVVNAGPETVHDAVVTIETGSDSVVPLRASYPVGTLEPNASVPVAFPVRVTGEGETGPRQFEVRVRYRTDDDDPRVSDSLFVRARVEPERDRFAVEPVNATFAPDSDNRFVVRVTNTGEAARSDVTVSLDPTPPFTSVAPTAYVPELGAGDSAVVAFELTVDEDAVESTHPVAVNVTSEGADGERTSERHRVAVAVATEEQPVETTTLAVVGGLAVLIVAGVAYWWYRRR